MASTLNFATALQQKLLLGIKVQESFVTPQQRDLEVSVHALGERTTPCNGFGPLIGPMVLAEADVSFLPWRRVMRTLVRTAQHAIPASSQQSPSAPARGKRGLTASRSKIAKIPECNDAWVVTLLQSCITPAYFLPDSTLHGRLTSQSPRRVSRHQHARKSRDKETNQQIGSKTSNQRSDV
eukprot:1335270-Amphidinium_carterae.1